jgi:hypothetical protein
MLRDWCMETWGSSGMSCSPDSLLQVPGVNMHAIRDAEETGTLTTRDKLHFET